MHCHTLKDKKKVSNKINAGHSAMVVKASASHSITVRSVLKCDEDFTITIGEMRQMCTFYFLKIFLNKIMPKLNFSLAKPNQKKI